MKLRNEIFKGQFLSQLGYEFESHSYCGNQLEKELVVKSINEEIFQF